MSGDAVFELYLRYEYWLAAAQLTLALFGMGAALSVQDFARVFTFPKAFVVGLTLQVLGVPAIAYALIALGGLSPGLAAGLAVISVTPGGSLTNVLTHISGGNSALSVAMTAFATLLCLVTVPAFLSILIADYMPADFEMPARRIALDIFAFLLTPLAIGMLIYRFAPSVRRIVSVYSIRASLVVVALILLGALGSGRIDWEVLSIFNIAVTFGLGGVLIIATLLTAPLFGVSQRDLAAIQIEVVGRNVNLGVLLMASVFPATTLLEGGAGDPVGSAAFSVLLLYGGYGVFLMIVVALAHGALAKRRAALGPSAART